MDYRSAFVVKPGSNVDLDKIDPLFTGPYKGKSAKSRAKKDLAVNLERLNELQNRMYAGGEYSAILVNQAPDAAGKDGLIKHVYGAMNPQGTHTVSFKAPSPIEARHHYLWRNGPHEPQSGHVSIFNRSHYEETLIVRVRNLISEPRWNRHFKEYLKDKIGDKDVLEAAKDVDFKSLINEYGLRDPASVKDAYDTPAVTAFEKELDKKGLKLKDVIKDGAKAFWQIRFDEINNYERALVRNGTQIQKFYLHIDKETQLKRFWDRVADPQKNWKISDADYSERVYWDAYQQAYDEMLSATSTEHAPWYIIPASKKWFARLAVSDIVSSNFEDLGMEYPEPVIDANEIKEKYFGVKNPGDKPRFDLV